MLKKFQVLLQSRWIAWGVGVLLVVLSVRTILSTSFFRPHDFTHAARLVEMQRSLQNGEFPVRWSRNFGFGYGMPLFNFYAPLPYYIGQVPLLLGFSSIDTIKFLYILNGILAFLGMYLLASELWGKTGGLLSAAAFSFSSYRAVDLFVRGAIGEAFAMVLLPFLFYGILLGNKGKKGGYILAGVALASILLSHNLIGMISLVVMVAFWGLTVFSKNAISVRRSILGLLLALLLGLGLSAFYALPAFFEKGYTRVDQTITVGYFDYHNHFLCASQLFSGRWGYGGSVPGCDDGISFSLGIFGWILFVAGTLVVLRFGKKDKIFLLGCLLFLFAVTTGMTIGRSSFIWDHLIILRYFQFPWRFLTFSHVFFALIMGGLGLLASKDRRMVFFVFLLVVGVVLSQIEHYQPEKQLAGNELTQYYATTPVWIRSEVSKTLNDYMPPRITDNALPLPVESRLAVDQGKIVVGEDISTRIRSQVFCPKDCNLRVNIFQFPGWKAKVDGKPVMLSENAEGLPIYSLPLERGDHDVDIYFSDTQIRKTGNFLSVIAIVSLGILCFLNLFKRARSKAV